MMRNDEGTIEVTDLMYQVIARLRFSQLVVCETSEVHNRAKCNLSALREPLEGVDICE